MTIFTGILLIIVIGFIYFHFTTFIEIKKEPVKKVIINLTFLKKLIGVLIVALFLFVLFYLPFTGVLSEGNKSYAGSLAGSFLAVTGALSAAYITVKMNKKNEEEREFPIKYASLQEIITNSRKYIFSLDIIVFNRDVLDNADQYMFTKLEEFIEYYQQTLNSLTFISTDASLEFIDLLKVEKNLATSVLANWKKEGEIKIYSTIYLSYEMFQTDEAKRILRTGKKHDENEQDDTLYRIIDGFILSQIFLPNIDEKISSFTIKLNKLDEEMRAAL